MRGRTGFEASDYPQGRLLREAWDVAKAVPTKEVVEAGFKGPEIREELTKRRIDAVAAWKGKTLPSAERLRAVGHQKKTTYTAAATIKR